MQKPYLEVGEIVTTHGVIGECKVYPWCDDPALFRKLKVLYWDAAGARGVRVLGVKFVKDMPILRLEGVESVEEARRLVNRVLYAARSDIRLPKGRYFVQDIVGFFSVAERQVYPVNAKYYMTLDGLDMGYTSRARSIDDFTPGCHMEIEEMHRLTAFIKQQIGIN